MTCISVYLISHISYADNILDMLNKNDLAARAKKMKATAQASPAKDLKLKAVAEVVPSDDEETYSGPIFKRRRTLCLICVRIYGIQQDGG